MAGRATKVHLAVDVHGNPITFILSDGTTHDVKVAPDLVDKVNLSNTEVLYADKGYDSDALHYERILNKPGHGITSLENETLSLLTTIWTGTYIKHDT